MRNARSILGSARILFLITILAAVFPAHAEIVRNPINLADYKGKWVVINYWASWCGYCREEMPELNAFYRSNRERVAMFGVDYEDATIEEMKEHIRDSDIDFPTLSYDPGRYFPFHVGQISGLPTTLVIDPNGRLRHVLEGPQTKRSLERAINL